MSGRCCEVHARLPKHQDNKRRPPRCTTYPSYITNEAPADRNCRDLDLRKELKIKKGGALKGKEVVRLINHDMIRDLLIPRDYPNTYPAVVEKYEYERIKRNAKTLSEEEKLSLLAKEKEEKDRKMAECLHRKDHLRQLDLRRAKMRTSKPEGNELEKKPENYAVARASELRQEQDDDMKLFNKLILSSKCNAIRDAQIAERALLKKELEAEEKHWEHMLEQYRRTSLKQEEEEHKKDLERKQKYVKSLLNQIRENEITKVLEAESLEEEARKIHEAAIAMQEEEKERQKKIELQKKIREEMAELNKQQQHFKALEQEAEKILDQKVCEYQREKARLEECRAQAHKAQTLQQNQEFAKLWTLHEKQHDLQEELNELNEQRILDEVERQWRRQEQEAARRIKKQNDDLKKAREAQLRDLRQIRAMEMAREKQEYEIVLKKAEEDCEAEKQREAMRQKALEEYRKGLLTQMTEKEWQRIKAKQQSYEEAKAMRLQEESHKREIKNLMCKKVEELKSLNIPEVYIKEVERKSQLKKDPE